MRQREGERERTDFCLRFRRGSGGAFGIIKCDRRRSEEDKWSHWNGGKRRAADSREEREGRSRYGGCVHNVDEVYWYNVDQFNYAIERSIKSKEVRETVTA